MEETGDCFIQMIFFFAIFLKPYHQLLEGTPHLIFCNANQNLTSVRDRTVVHLMLKVFRAKCDFSGSVTSIIKIFKRNNDLRSEGCSRGYTRLMFMANQPWA